MDPHDPTSSPDVPELGRQRENAKTEPIQGIISSQGGALLSVLVVLHRESAPPHLCRWRIPTVPDTVGTTRGEDKLSVGPEEDLIGALAARIERPGGSSLLEKFLVEKEIEPEFWNRVGD